jgi:hypothetical protein
MYRIVSLHLMLVEINSMYMINTKVPQLIFASLFVQLIFEFVGAESAKVLELITVD